mmetsp:Transcript_3590/g.7032  ORF Transcript_3590/g.7032 Transcript_3590/m.7032 type:complete len:217 (+) Transcript_3590:1-651(+)
MLASTVVTLQFWGCAVLLLLASALSQQLIASMPPNSVSYNTVQAAAELPGMAAYGEQQVDPDSEGEDGGGYETIKMEGDMKEKEKEHKERLKRLKRAAMALGRFCTAVAKYLLENAFQLWLQASLFAIIFDMTTEDAKLKMLLGMGLGLTSLLHKFLEAVVEWYQFGGLWATITIVPSFLSVLVAAWTAFKLKSAYDCESHMWNLGGGCVQNTTVV